VNGYFTVSEYPVLEALHRVGGRAVTDLDVMAFRFPHAGHHVVRGHGHEAIATDVDEALGAPADRPDMIIGEIKEGRARFNPATRDPSVLRVALARFGCCPADHLDHVVAELLSRGRAQTPVGHAVRMVAFGASAAPGNSRWHTVSLEHVVAFLRAHLQNHWPILRHAQLRDPGLAYLALLEKCRGTDRAEDCDVDRHTSAR